MDSRESRNKFWKGALVGALLTAFAGLIIVGMSMGIYLIGKTVIDGNGQMAESGEATHQEGTLDIERIGSKIKMIQEIIDNFFLFDEDTEEVEEWIYKGMMAGLDDPYSVYYTAEEYEKLNEDTEGEYNGIGVMISQNRSTGIITVSKVFENTPASEAGMRPGDILYKVGDMEVTGMDLDILVKDYIKGKDGSEVTLTVFRQDSGEYVDMTMERRDVEVQTVTSKMVEEQVGYIEVSQFDVVTAEQFNKAIDDLEKQGMEKLVIDLRNNPGGLLETAVSMMDYILADDLQVTNESIEKTIANKTLLVYTADKNGKGSQLYSRDGHEVKMPIAILVNGDSASASEVFSGALQDYGKAKLVGTATFGKGIVQNVIPLDNGTAIKMTVAHYYTPSGFDLHGKGLKPDVEVELKEELKTKVTVDPEEDNQLQEAVRVLKEENQQN